MANQYRTLMYRARKALPRDIDLETEDKTQVVVFLPKELHLDAKKYCSVMKLSLRTLYENAIIDYLSKKDV